MRVTNHELPPTGGPLAPAQLAEAVSVGALLQIWYGAGNINNVTQEVRAIVDGDQVVTRREGRRGWQYSVEHLSWFELLAEQGHLYQRQERRP